MYRHCLRVGIQVYTEAKVFGVFVFFFFFCNFFSFFIFFFFRRVVYRGVYVCVRGGRRGDRGKVCIRSHAILGRNLHTGLRKPFECGARRENGATALAHCSSDGLARTQVERYAFCSRVPRTEIMPPPTTSA